MRRLPTSPAEALGSVSLRGRPFAAIWRGARRPGWRDSVQNSGAREAPDQDLPLRRLEAVLFLAREPLSSRKLAQLATLEDGTRARTLIRRLNSLYDASPRAFRVEEVAGGYQLLTRQKFASWLRRLGHIPAEIRLSSPALETLAVVAYRQPVLKADIEAIRGVHCGEILRQLMERDLVRIGGRSEELGRPYLYTTTKRFLQQFGLRSIEDLPRAEILKTAWVPPVGKVAETAHHTSNPYNEDMRTIVDKESDVSVTLSPELDNEEKLARHLGPQRGLDVRAEDDDDLEEEIDDEDDDDDLDDEDDEDDLDDEEEDDDIDDEEWEEVEDEEADDEDEDDEDWEDEDEDWDEEDDEDVDDEDDDEDDEDWEEEEEEGD